MIRFKPALILILASSLIAAQPAASPRAKRSQRLPQTATAKPEPRRPAPAPDDPAGAMRWRRLAWLSADGTIPRGTSGS